MTGGLLHPVTRLFRGAIDELFPDTVAHALAQTQWEPDLPCAYCPRCGVSAGPGAVTQRGCSFCLDRRLPWHRLVRLGSYRDPLDGWIRTMKFQRQWRWGQWLGSQLAPRLPEPFDPERVLVCPVPMPWRRRWQRGYNQSALIAEALARGRGWPGAELLWRRYARPQTAVSISHRPANVRRSFALGRVDLTGWEVVLVDDVKTTGATLACCARLLRRAGARCIYAAVAAVAEPQELRGSV